MKQLGRVVGRDGNYVGTVQDLYTALAEDVALWGFYRRFECEFINSRTLLIPRQISARRGCSPQEEVTTATQLCRLVSVRSPLRERQTSPQLL